MALPQLLARAHIQQRDGEEDKRVNQHEEVLHFRAAFLLSDAESRRQLATWLTLLSRRCPPKRGVSDS